MAINGLSYSTAEKLEELKNGTNKKPEQKAKKPAAKNEKYSQSRDALLKSYLEREPYEFNINTDRLYRQYADAYKKQGEAAMRDTVAQASALTGGYGSSYAVTAGAQAYQGYLDKLNSIVPELERDAYDRYTAEGKNIRENIGILDGLDTKEYDSYRDRMEDYKDERDYYRSVYEYESDRDYDTYKALTDYILALAKLENSDYHSDRELELAYDKLNNESYHKDVDRRFEMAKLQLFG